MFQFDVSFIIPAQSTGGSLIPTLDSIFLQKTNFTFEVIVILAPNETLDYKGEVSVLNAPQTNASSARNAGLAKASGEFIALIDSDTVLAKDWLDLLMKEMKTGPWLGAQGRIKTTSLRQNSLFSEFRRLSSFVTDDALILSRYPLPILNSAACLYRRNSQLMFNSELMAGEDIELSWRLFCQGPAGFYYSGSARAECFYFSENFIRFFIRNFKLGLSFGKIIYHQNLNNKIFREIFLRSMRQNLFVEMSKRKGFSLFAIATRFCASLVTNLTCHISAYFPGKKYASSLSREDQSPMSVLVNNQEMDKSLRMVGSETSLRIIDLTSFHERYYPQYEVFQKKSDNFLIICHGNDGEKK